VEGLSGTMGSLWLRFEILLREACREEASTFSSRKPMKLDVPSHGKPAQGDM
jgi:hypothetical protein